MRAKKIPTIISCATSLVTLTAVAICFDNCAARADAPAKSTKAVTALPDGNYSGVDKSVNLGSMEIKGTTYRGLVTEGDYHDYTIDGSNTITWKSSLSGLEDGWKLTSSSYLGPNKAGKPVIKIGYTTADGKAASMEAVHD